MPSFYLARLGEETRGDKAREREETGGKQIHEKGIYPMHKQHDIPTGPMPTFSMRSLEDAVISACSTAQDAVDLAYQMARPRRSIRDKNHQPGLATVMGCSPGEVSKRLRPSGGNDSRFAQAIDQILTFERATHTRAITQYMAHCQGGLWVPRELSEAEKRDRELRELRAKVAQLEAVA